MEPKKILDQCTRTSHTANKEPAPSTHGGDRRFLGITFDEHSPQNYDANCVTLHNPYSAPKDCRWHDCDHTSHSSLYINTQMTMAIYVR